eukprot:355455-Chlamydomonas_euryale.AAC.2
MALTDHHRLEFISDQCGTSPVESTRRRTFQWMGHVLSAAEDGRVEQPKLRPSHRSIEDIPGTALKSGAAMRKAGAMAVSVNPGLGLVDGVSAVIVMWRQTVWRALRPEKCEE